MKEILTLILITLFSLNSRCQRVDWNTQDYCHQQLINYHDNGSIKEVGCFSSDLKRVGKWHFFSPEGVTLALVSFDDLGKKHGDWKIWSDLGQLKAHMKYDHGKRIGTWIAVLEDGTIQEKKYTNNE